MMSTVGFIHNVAAIVIQTAFRRYQARHFVKRLHKRQQASSPTRLRNQLFPSPPRQKHDRDRATTPSLDHSLEVRQCLGLPMPQSSAYSEPIVDTSPLKAISRSSRSRKATKFDPFEERLFTLAAIRIQSLFRGFWVRDCLNVDNYCATVIQHAYRRHCYRMEFKFQVYRIMIVQSVWRRQLARREASFRLVCVLLLQSAIRRFLEHRERTRGRCVVAEPRESKPRSAYRTSRSKQSDLSRAVPRRQGSKEDVAATLIQKNWRSFYYETNYLKTLLDVLLVQTAVRRWFAVRRVHHMKAAQQRLKRRHRYVAAASRRRAASRVAPSSTAFTSSPVPSPLAGKVAAKSQPAVVTPRRYIADSKDEGSGACSASSDASEDGPSLKARPCYGGKLGLRKFEEVKVNSKPPLPTATAKIAVAVVTPKAWPPKANPRYPDDYGGSSTGSTSALTEDDVRIETASPPPGTEPCLIEEDSPGGAKAILSLWRERDKKNSSSRR
jgi:IQ calmodulin-binding motif